MHDWPLGTVLVLFAKIIQVQIHVAVLQLLFLSLESKENIIIINTMN